MENDFWKSSNLKQYKTKKIQSSLNSVEQLQKICSRRQQLYIIDSSLVSIETRSDIMFTSIIGIGRLYNTDPWLRPFYVRILI